MYGIQRVAGLSEDVLGDLTSVKFASMRSVKAIPANPVRAKTIPNTILVLDGNANAHVSSVNRHDIE